MNIESVQLTKIEAKDNKNDNSSSKFLLNVVPKTLYCFVKSHYIVRVIY